MIHMPVPAIAGDVHCRLVFPFLELSCQTDLRAGKLLECRLDFLHFRRVALAQHIRRQDHIVEDIPHNRLVECASQRIRPVLRRIGRADHKGSVPFILHKDIYEEDRGLEHGVIIFRQELFIHIKGVDFPDILAQPCRCRRREERVRYSRSRVAPDIIFVEGGPSSCPFPEYFFRSLRSSRDKAVDVFDQRQMALRKIRLLCQPVVHLHVDICVIVCIPRRSQAVRPDPLEIGREGSLS